MNLDQYPSLGVLRRRLGGRVREPESGVEAFRFALRSSTGLLQQQPIGGKPRHFARVRQI
jgi:hypothetical protein